MLQQAKSKVDAADQMMNFYYDWAMDAKIYGVCGDPFNDRVLGHIGTAHSPCFLY